VLQPYPEELKQIVFENMAHMSANSAVYNRMLSMANTSYDNNSQNNKIAEIRGPHSVTISGSPYSYVPTLNPSANSGVSYFTFDGLDHLMEHGNIINASQSKVSAKLYGPRIIPEILATYFESIREYHRFAHGKVYSLIILCI
jgi:hypothetical protein